MVDEVTRVDLTEGNTMIIPTGWIHAVVRGKIASVLFSANFCVVYTAGCISIRRQFSPLIQRCTSYVCSPHTPPGTHSSQNSGCVRLRMQLTSQRSSVSPYLQGSSVSMSRNLVFATLTSIGFAGTLVRSTCAIFVPRRISPIASWSQSRSFPIFW